MESSFIWNSLLENIYITYLHVLEFALYKGKSLNNRNFILKCMEKYARRKILFRDTKWLLSNMSYRGRNDQAVWACTVGRRTWPLHCQLAPWKSNEALFVFLWFETFWNLQKNEGSVWRQLFESGERVWLGGKFQNGRQNVSDEHRSGRPVSVASETVKQQVEQGIRKLVDRWTKCVAKQGDYVEK